MDPGPLAPFYELFDRLLAARNRRLAEHLAACGLLSEMFLFGWLQTVFLKALPLPSASRVWDGFLLDGTPFLYRVAAALLDLLAPRLLRFGVGGAPEETIQLLTQPPAMRRHWERAWAEVTPADVLLPAAEAVELPPDVAAELDDLVHSPFFYRHVPAGVGGGGGGDGHWDAGRGGGGGGAGGGGGGGGRGFGNGRAGGADLVAAQQGGVAALRGGGRR
jgi:uncharacterized membrane protein YgcG